MILSGVVLYDQYGRSISAGPQSYDNGYGYYGYYNSGNTPPNIQVSYQNNASGAVTQVEYQVPTSAIPPYDNSGTAMVADLVYTPVESQQLPLGEYSIRVDLTNPEQNITTNFGQGSSFFDYFYMTNVSTPLATLIVDGVEPPEPVDSDGDGVNDYREIADGTDSNDPTSLNSFSKGLVIYYPFQGNLRDESGFGNDVALAGGNLTSGRSDAENSALQVGIQDGAKSLKNVGITGNSNFTVSFWMKPTLQPKWPEAFVIGWGAIPTKEGKVSHFYYRPYHSGANLYIDEGYVGAEVLSHPTNLTGIWSHITYTYDSVNRSFAIYRNGLLQTTNYQTYNMELHNLGDSKLYLGGPTKTGDHPPDEYGGRGLVGNLDDIRIYNRALSAAEVAQLYNKESENPNMFTVQGGTLPQASELAGQAVGTFQIGKYEVTWGEWKAVHDWAVANSFSFDNNGSGSTDLHPVANVSWYDALKWCNAKSQMEGLTPVYQTGGSTYRTGQSAPTVNSVANGYRLPLEKEWEWAARGGIFSNGYVFSGGNDLGEVAWWLNNSDSSANVVGRKIPNELGIFDMTGNVREMTWSNIRGGDWTIWNPSLLLINQTFSVTLNQRDASTGFRIACNSGTPDTTAPVIALNGANPQTVYKGSTYTDTGAVVTDDVDAPQTIQGSGVVSPSLLGVYTITYTATDAAGNAAEPVTRTINVVLDPQGDEDGDGLTNAEEQTLGTDPYNPDSDGDGNPDQLFVRNFAFWGTNSPEGRLSIPESLTYVKSIDAGFNHTLALKFDGTLVAWGGNGGAEKIATVPNGLANVVEIDCGWAWNLVRKSDGSLYAWGANDCGQISSLPSGFDFIQISAGNMHAAALKADGTIVCWGRNDMGQCNVPAGLSGVIKVIAYGHHTIALLSDGTVKGWGVLNNYQSAAAPLGLTDVKDLAVGDCFNLALRGDGTVVAWGDNTYGQTNVPAGLSNVKNIFATADAAFAVKNDGTVVSWGNNQSGQRNIPSTVNGSYILDIRGNAYHAFARLAAEPIEPVADTIAPVIVLNGEELQEVYKGSTYLDPGAMVTDNVDAVRTISGDGTVDTSTIGDYTITYTAQDAAGNVAETVTRTVRVVLNPAGDEDGDGLTNGQEEALETNPSIVDTDGDGISDKAEVESGSDPLGAVAISEEMISVESGALPEGSALAGESVEGFQIGKNEVTWAEWKAVRHWAVANGYSDLAEAGSGGGQAHPVRDVSWYDVVKWCNAKSEWEGLTPVYTVNGTVYRAGELAWDEANAVGISPTASGYRLPTEAQWEWAARGGLSSQNLAYSGSNIVDEVAWYFDNSEEGTKQVGTKSANELGIHDMSGNVWEWCWNETAGSGRQIRGGGYWNLAEENAIANRDESRSPDVREGNLGFRLVTLAVQVIEEFPVIEDKTYGDLPFVVPPLAASSGLAVSLSVKSGPATISENNTISLSGTGTVVLAANQAGNGFYKPAQEVTVSFNVIKANQTLGGFGVISGKAYGNAPFAVTGPAASSGLPVMLSVKAGAASISGNNIVTLTGVGNVTLAANQGGSVNYNAAAEVVTTFLVTQGTPTINTAPTATAITFGQALSNSTLSGGAGNVAGTFAFATPMVVPAVGSSARSVVFTPTDSGNYTTATGNVTVLVNKAASSITTLPTATAITFGQALSNSTLSGGVGNVAGSFAFETPTVVPGVGSSARSVVFTPTDSGNYTTATGNVTVLVNKAASSIATLPTATAIAFGQALSNSTLSGGAGNVAGTFAFATPTVVPGVGSSAYSVVFTPTDSGNYTTATGNVTVLVNKAASTITTLPTATAIAFGQALSNSTLSGGAGNVAGTFAFETPTVVPGVGSSARSVLFTPTDSGNYTTATANVTVLVNKAASSIATLPTATAISFGQALSNSTLSGGAGNVAGSFAFATPMVIPAVGSSARSVVFTPTDSGNYTTATGNVTVLVNKAASSITTLPTATAIAFGQALSNSTLSGGAGNVAGSFAFATPTVVPGVGSSARSVVFTPTDSGNYTTATANVTVVVNRAASSITTLSTATAITFGQALSNSTLSGGAGNVAGTFAFETPTVVPAVGSSAYSVVFTPTDSGNYTTATANVTVVVNKAASSITTLPTATAIAFGQALSNSTLSGGAGNVAGTFAFATPTVVPGVGSSAYSVVFTPSDSGNYTTATGNVTVVVNKAASSITTLPTSTAIAFGQALSNSTLSGGAGNVAGTFAFATPTVVPGVGSSARSVLFAPTDSGNYTTATANVTVVVNKAASSIATLPTATAIAFGQALSNSTLSGGAGNVAGTFAFETPTVVPGMGSSAYSVVFTPSDSGNYTTATGNVTVAVSKAPSSITTLPTATAISFGQALSNSTLSGGTGNVAGTFAFATPTVVPGVGSSAYSVVFTPTDSGNYTTATANVTVVVNKAASSITTLPTATAIAFGHSLSNSTLSGGAGNVAGTFAFETPTVVPGVGSSARSVLFTPTDSGNYTTATGNVTVLVNKAAQTIEAFATISTKAYGNAPFVVVAPAATSGLPVTLSVRSGNATISANKTVTLTGIGTVILAANQSGNSNYNAAAEVSTTFNVTRPISNLTILSPSSSDGSVTQEFAGITQREVGATYTVSAIPASGMIFKEWRKNNTSLTTNATLKFTMQPNLTLTPVFSIDFAKLAGLYNGLVGTGEIGTGSLQDIQSFPVKNGFVAFNLTASGVVSGNLSIEGQTSPFTGKISSNKTVSISVVRARKTAAPAALQLIAALPGEISGNITVSGNKLPFRALRAAYTTNATEHALGNRTYTVIIPPPDGVLAGYGFASVMTKGNGSALLTGRLATGDTISASAGFVDSGDGNWVLPVYSTSNSILTGEIVIPKVPAPDAVELSGTMEWLRKPAASSAALASGFLKRSNISGARFSIVAGSSLIGGNSTTANFTLAIDSQKRALASALTQKGIWPANNTPSFIQPVSSGLAMTFSSATGNFTGSFNRPVNGSAVPTAFQGAMFGKPVSTGNGQPILRGAGYFISGNQSVPVEITLP